MNNATQYVVLIVYASLLLIVIIFAIATHLLLSKQKARNYQMRLLESDRRFETELMKIKLELHEEALNTFSREIHDNIGQVLSSVSLTLQSILDANLTGNQERAITASSLRINKVTHELRDLSHLLNGKRVEKIGLISALRNEISYLKLNNQMEVTFQDNGTENMPELSGSQVLLIFRIAQEAIHNVIRHASATKMKVGLSYEPPGRTLSMKISDNGIGFGQNTAPGMGLQTMKERSRLLNGNLSITSHSSEGSTIQLSLKL